MCLKLIKVLENAREPQIYVSFHKSKSVENWVRLNQLIKMSDSGIKLYGTILEHNSAEAEKWLAENGVDDPLRCKNIRYITSHSFAGHVNNRKSTYGEIEVRNRIRNCASFSCNKVCVAWDGRIKSCCLDSEVDNNLGSVFEMEKVRHNLDGYAICSNCDPDFMTGFQ